MESEIDLAATRADFAELLKANPGLELPLVGIIQRRLLNEKDAKIQELQQDLTALSTSNTEAETIHAELTALGLTKSAARDMVNRITTIPWSGR